ncbi:dipeptidase [Haladaptatus cibarius]|uniref:dipeptidase n=1 Tax=Haladaptatus cibarius TaxID=453847 RepID=UPI000679636D|nr:dipeptidase [Haladaptatus cibarius]
MTVPIIDGHNDTLLRLLETDTPISTFESGIEDTHIDLPSAIEAGLGAGFFAVFVLSNEEHDSISTEEGYEHPLPDAVSHDDARGVTYRTLELLSRLAHDVDDFRLVRTLSDLETCLESGTLGAIPHLEGAAGVARDLANLDFLYEAGVRSIGPVWSRPNAFGEGVQSRYPGSPDTGSGLTDAGRDLVRACEDRGIAVDCAHMTEQGFWDVAELTDAPLVVSHSGVHELSSHSRNLTDEQLTAIADSGGVVGISLHEPGLADSPDPDAEIPLETVIDHIEYVAEFIGAEHVVFGSDFDGARIPDEVGDVTGLPKILARLRERGFSDEEVENVARENWRRVLAETW